MTSLMTTTTTDAEKQKKKMLKTLRRAVEDSVLAHRLGSILNIETERDPENPDVINITMSVNLERRSTGIDAMREAVEE